MKHKKIVKRARKTTKKKVVIKQTKKQKSRPGVMAVIPYNEIIKPEIYKGKFTLTPSPFGENLIKFILRPTPKSVIYKREGSSGKMFDYVPGWYAKKCANFAFGFSHSFEIKEKKIIGMSAIVEGRLIISNPKTGKEILHKDDSGGHIIRFFKGKEHIPENAVDIANDFKSASTDCLKRCMVQMGFFSDVYGRNESIEEGVEIQEEQNGKEEKPQPENTSGVDVEAELFGLAVKYGAKEGHEIEFIERKVGKKIAWNKLNEKSLRALEILLRSKMVKNGKH